MCVNLSSLTVFGYPEFRFTVNAYLTHGVGPSNHFIVL